MVCVCLMYSCSFSHMCFLLCLSLLLPYTASGRGEGPPPLTCPPSLHSGTVVMQPFSSKRPLPLRGSNTHHGKDQKEDTQIPEGHQCLVVCSSGTHSIGAPQTYSVKCSQGLKVLGDKENVCELC